jgi:CRP-like cAMP-binding protein
MAPQSGRTWLKHSASATKKTHFNPHAFLSTVGKGREMMSYHKKQTIFAQGDSTDGLFFVQTGRVQLSVVSEAGKEATLAILGEGDFFGEGGLAGQLIRMSSASALTDCVLLHVVKKAMMLAMSREPTLSAMFVKYLLKRNIRYQDDLVDQLFNSSEKRLARVLLLMAHFGNEGVGNVRPTIESGDSGRDGRDNTITGQFLHESIPEAGFYQLRCGRQPACPQHIAERSTAR